MALTAAQCTQFRREHFLVVPGMIQKGLLRALQQELEGIVDEAAQTLYSRGQLTHLHSDLGFEHRLSALYNENTAVRRMVTRAAQYPRPSAAHPTAGREWFNLLTHGPLLEAVGQLLGSSSVVVSGNHRLRPKLPKHEDIFSIPW